MEQDLIGAAKAGNDSAFAELCRVYAPLIESMIAKYGGILAETDEERKDLRQEATVALYRALVTFDETQSKVTFGLYAKVCIRNRMVSLLRKHASAKNRKPEQEDVAPVGPASEIDRRALSEATERLLTAFERRVFLHYVDGRSYGEIASALGVSKKSVDNALFRAKRKMRRGFSDGFT
ncbi:MAG: sigma-70 family RNA polymerase sigma factor [Clostridia bacterium]|nr:sigma-70 family RNA polymerase sigma factor [Clostridia bacterium]